jgi:hypothetical protein
LELFWKEVLVSYVLFGYKAFDTINVYCFYPF